MVSPDTDREIRELRAAIDTLALLVKVLTPAGIVEGIHGDLTQHTSALQGVLATLSSQVSPTDIAVNNLPESFKVSNLSELQDCFESLGKQLEVIGQLLENSVPSPTIKVAAPDLSPLKSLLSDIKDALKVDNTEDIAEDGRHNQLIAILSEGFSKLQDSVRKGIKGSVSLGAGSIGRTTPSNDLRVVPVNSDGSDASPLGSVIVDLSITSTNISTATAAAAVTTSVKNGVIVQALSANVGTVKVGSSTPHFELQPGQSTSIAVNDASKVYFLPANSGDGICLISTN